LEATDTGNSFGYMLMKTGIGTLGLSFSPTMGPRSGVSCAIPNNMLGLQWANKGVGLGLLFGTNVSGFNYNDPLTALTNPDKSSTDRMFIGLQGGASLNVGMPLDLGLNLNLCSQNDESTDMSNTVANQKAAYDKTSASEVGVNIVARAEASDMLWVAGGTLAIGGREVTHQVDNNNNGVFTNPGDTNTLNKYSDNLFEAGVLAGKIIKATDSLKITLSTGLGIRFTGDEMTSTEDLVANTKTYGPFPGVNSYINGGIPVNIAVEGKLNDTWRILAGISTMALDLNNTNQKNRALITDQNPATSSYYTTGGINLNPGLNYDLGLTGVIGDLQIDFHVNPNVLIFGPNLLTGNTPYNMFAFQMAVAYSWK
jgi:hypothetical protein